MPPMPGDRPCSVPKDRARRKAHVVNELRTAALAPIRPLVIRPPVMYPDGRAECRTCGAHVRMGGRVGSTAAAWCSVCCTTSVYDTEPTRTAA